MIGNSMKFIELGSEDTYNHKEYKSVNIQVRRQSVMYHILYAPFLDFVTGEQIKAGWTLDKSFPSKILSIKELDNEFEDERTWEITLKRI